MNVPAGGYTLTIDLPGDQTGAYSFRLWDLSQATPLTPGTPVSGDLTPATETDLYRFTAGAGDRFFFDTLARTGAPSASWRLLDPYGNQVFSTGFGTVNTDVDVQTLGVTGTYTLLLEGRVSDTGTGSYTFNVQPAPLPTRPLTLGQTVSGVLATAGASDRYTFTLTQTSLLYFDSLTNSNSLTWTLTGPAGTAVTPRSFASSDGSTVLNPALRLVAGDYALTVDAPGDQTGAYSFRLSDLAAATPLPFETTVSGTLSPAASTNLHKFNAVAGNTFFESFYVPQALNAVVTARWRLLDPYGNVVFNTTLGTDQGPLTLAATGSYTLLVEGGIGDTGTGSYVLRVHHERVVDIVPSDPSVPFQNLTGLIASLGTPTFNVQFTGDGQAHAFDLLFRNPDTGLVLGSIPVTINEEYLYKVRAIDPDNDPLTYSHTTAPTGMAIDPSSGLITWKPTAAQVGANPVTVQVTDSRGGSDTQSFVVTVTSVTPGGIQGTVFNDLDGDGTRSPVTNATPPGGPFQPAGSPFPAVQHDTGPARIITIGPGGTLTVTSTDQGPYDGEDDTYVAVVNPANSGLALLALQLTGPVIFEFNQDGISQGGRTNYEGPGTYYTNIDAVTTNTGMVNFDDGFGNGLQPGQQAYFALEGIPASIVGTIFTALPPVSEEPALPAWTVYLDLNHNGKFDPTEPSSPTDPFGHYFFSNLLPGT